MPWKNTTTMDQKIEFICEWLTRKYTITELCKGFEISRPTAYKLIRRYQKHGIQGLREHSKTPINHPNRTKEYVEDNILNLKGKHPQWGAKKIQRLLFNACDKNDIPSVVTVHNILAKHGLVCPQKRYRKLKPTYPIFDPKECNEVWSADFKGKFKMGNKKYCHPLTIADSRSRFIFTAKALLQEDFKSTKKEFKRVFKQYGLPKQIHTDNGVPFGYVRAIQRFTRLSYWFIELGILPVFSDPAHPEQNGRHERMHRDLKAACTQPPSHDLKAQQRQLNKFVREYNYIRPHEALEMETPNEVHQYSNRRFPDRIKEYEYPHRMRVMKVTKSGAVRWKGYNWVYLSRGLIKKKVAAEEQGNGIWKVFYRDVFLGYFNENDIREKHSSTRLSSILV